MSFFIKTESWRKHRKLLFGAAFFGILSLGVLYVYFMNLTVLKTVERNINLTKLGEIKKEVLLFEESYIGKLSSLDISYAQSLGFVEAEPEKYIYRDKAVVQVGGYGQIIR